ncbi:MAG: PSD1 and planctomycete cytochrome C domain-containing protein [Akkermansiaceae bacterium]
MIITRNFVYSCLGWLAFLSPVRAEIDFAHEVVPILEKHCIECHGGDKSKGGLSMNTRALVLDADVLELGEPDDSILIELLTDEDPDFRMPPPDKGKEALTAKEIDVLKRWIAEDLPWTDGFTFAKDRYEPPLRPREVKLPKGPKGANPIDLIVAKHLKEEKIKPAGMTDDGTFLRRVSQDLVGLPPTKNLLSEFDQKRPLDREALVDRLLENDQAYAEHWMTFWNDLLRNEYAGTGFITGGRKQITKWLYPALLENKPFDEFVSELVAPGPDSKGFIEGIKWRGEVNASQTTEIQFSQNVSQVFLGINMKCASCHDSFIDRWTLEEAYGLAAIYSEKELELARCDKPTGRKAKAAWLFPELGQIDPLKPRDERLQQLADLIVHPENGRTQRTIVNRLWAQLMGRGIVHPVDAMGTEPWNEDLLDFLGSYLVANDYDMKAVIKLIATSRTYQFESAIREEESEAYVFRGPVRKRMTAEQFLDSVRQVVGVWPKPDKDAFKGKGASGGQLTAVMKAHGIEKWDDRPVRTVFVKRDALQASLGRPNREQVVTARPDKLTTLEAINLANGPELASIITAGAKKLGTEKDPEVLAKKVFLASLSRSPTTTEINVARELLGNAPTTEQVEDFLWSVFMLPEFLYIN